VVCQGIFEKFFKFFLVDINRYISNIIAISLNSTAKIVDIAEINQFIVGAVANNARYLVSFDTNSALYESFLHHNMYLSFLCVYIIPHGTPFVNTKSQV
jgi:hypothetical protein